MKDCETRQQDLKACLDGELPPLRRMALRWHLLRCARCREERDAMREISQSLKMGEGDALDPALRARILSSVTYAVNEAPPPERKHRRRSSPVLFLWGAAAAGVLAGVFLRPLWQPAHESARMPSAASSVQKDEPSQAGASKSIAAPVSSYRNISAPASAPSASAKTQIAPAKPPAIFRDSNTDFNQQSVEEKTQQQDAIPYKTSPEVSDQNAAGGKVREAQKEDLQNNQNIRLNSMLKQEAPSHNTQTDKDNAMSLSGTLNASPPNGQQAARIRAEKTKAQPRSKKNLNSSGNRNTNANTPAAANAPAVNSLPVKPLK
jgi:hypothetical protein